MYKVEKIQAGIYKVEGRDPGDVVTITRNDDQYKGLWVIQWAGDYTTTRTLKDAKTVAIAQVSYD